VRKRREINAFSISFLDLLSGALGAVIILYVAIPKQAKAPEAKVVPDVVKQLELEKKLEAAQTRIAQLERPVGTVPSVDRDFDVGFQFKGKKIVFLVDTSYSMIEEDRMGQVRAGLKMLITSMPPSYEIDLIQFPFGERAPFRTMFGTIRPLTETNRHETNGFLATLKPSGGTPTRDALLFTLRNYNDVTDIVLLSDGAPTYHNQNRKDDIHDILKTVKMENPNGIQISTIGVGQNFGRDRTQDSYIFLSQLAGDHKGFFVGF
jgi:Mg-chelatase subunit ChlD